MNTSLRWFVVTFISIFMAGSAVPGSAVYGEMAKEGSGEYRSAKSTVYTALPMGKERIQLNYDSTGTVVSAPENSPLYNATFWTIGSSHAINKVFNGTGFIVYTNPGGDKIYATAEFNGILKGGYTCTLTFVGGTGACTGIQGTVNFKGIAGLKSSKKGINNGISMGRFTWKIP